MFYQLAYFNNLIDFSTKILNTVGDIINVYGDFTQLPGTFDSSQNYYNPDSLKKYIWRSHEEISDIADYQNMDWLVNIDRGILTEEKSIKNLNTATVILAVINGIALVSLLAFYSLNLKKTFKLTYTIGSLVMVIVCCIFVIKGNFDYLNNYKDAEIARIASSNDCKLNYYYYSNGVNEYFSRDSENTKNQGLLEASQELNSQKKDMVSYLSSNLSSITNKELKNNIKSKIEFYNANDIEMNITNIKATEYMKIIYYSSHECLDGFDSYSEKTSFETLKIIKSKTRIRMDKNLNVIEVLPMIIALITYSVIAIDAVTRLADKKNLKK